MRLGAWTCKIEPDTLAYRIYGKGEISERHRHRYEFNREYEEPMVAAGLRISGSTPDGTYVEMVELPDHPHFIGCQFHPEFKSKPLEPHLIPAHGGPADRTGETIDHVGFRLADHDGMRRKLDGLGISSSRMELPELGERRLFIRTPTGILLELVFRDTKTASPSTHQEQTNDQ